MSAQQTAIKAYKNKDKMRLKKMRSMIYDAESVLSFTAMQVLFVSFAFILMVILLHVVTKFVPSTSPVKLFISVIILCASIGISAYLNQK